MPHKIEKGAYDLQRCDHFASLLEKLYDLRARKHVEGWHYFRRRWTIFIIITIFGAHPLYASTPSKYDLIVKLLLRLPDVILILQGGGRRMIFFGMFWIGNALKESSSWCIGPDAIVIDEVATAKGFLSWGLYHRKFVSYLSRPTKIILFTILTCLFGMHVRKRLEWQVLHQWKACLSLSLKTVCNYSERK